MMTTAGRGGKSTGQCKYYNFIYYFFSIVVKRRMIIIDRICCH